jgi:hypothetical protein
MINNQTSKIEKKDLAAILQNHKSEALKNSVKKYEEAPKLIDTTWHNYEYDAHEIPGICIISQTRVSDYNQMCDSKTNIFLIGKNIETAVYLHDNKDSQYKIAEYSRGETPEKAYDSLIKRLQEERSN